MKKIVSKVIFLVFIIVVITSIILIKVLKPKDLTKSVYDKILTKDSYTFIIKEQMQDVDFGLTISKLNNDLNIDVISEGERTSTLIKNGVAYYIVHSEKEYYIYDSKDIDADILKEGFSDIENKTYIKGHEKINNESYYYEEYDGITTFIMWNDFNEQDKIKVRFYFKGSNLMYIKTIINDSEEELIKVDFTIEADSTLFEIPADFAEK